MTPRQLPHRARSTADMRSSYKNDRPTRVTEIQYCCDCKHHKRGNTWDLDGCKKFKTTCKAVRYRQGMFAAKCDDGFEAKKG